MTSLKDQNNTISIYGNHKQYHSGGQYYIRLRPDFALYDMITNRQYVYDMYTFSMPPASYSDEALGFEIMELLHDYIGYINGTMY